MKSDSQESETLCSYRVSLAVGVILPGGTIWCADLGVGSEIDNSSPPHIARTRPPHPLHSQLERIFLTSDQECVRRIDPAKSCKLPISTSRIRFLSSIYIVLLTCPILSPSVNEQ